MLKVDKCSRDWLEGVMLQAGLWGWGEGFRVWGLRFRV